MDRTEIALTPARALQADAPAALADEVCCPQILESPLTEEDAALAARVFKALGDPTRVRLLSMIASAPSGEACVCELVDSLDLSQPTVSHHLRQLLQAGLVERERRGTWSYYRTRAESLDAIARAVSLPGT